MEAKNLVIAKIETLKSIKDGFTFNFEDNLEELLNLINSINDQYVRTDKTNQNLKLSSLISAIVYGGYVRLLSEDKTYEQIYKELNIKKIEDCLICKGIDFERILELYGLSAVKKSDIGIECINYSVSSTFMVEGSFGFDTINSTPTTPNTNSYLGLGCSTTIPRIESNWVVGEIVYESSDCYLYNPTNLFSNGCC